MSKTVVPFSLKDAPALIERLLPVQKLSAESYKEQMAGSGKTLTALGSYWKGRKPLILNKACILGCLLPATDDVAMDLAIFEKLMAMDDESFVIRWKRRFKPKDILSTLAMSNPAEYFSFHPSSFIPHPSPWDWSNPEYEEVKISWREDITELERRNLEAQMLPKVPYRDMLTSAKRPEEVMETVNDHIWDIVNEHLSTNARSVQELVEQLGIMRFGHRPIVADTFCGSGQIPFEAARLGCDVSASDLNPVACMLTWGALNIIGRNVESSKKLLADQRKVINKVQTEIDNLKIESDGTCWIAKVFLYCIEVRCPQSGWVVPLLSTRVISKSRKTIIELIPDRINQRYEIQVRNGVTNSDLAKAIGGTIGREGRFGEAYLIHNINGNSYKTKISTLRGDYANPHGIIENKLRPWDKNDFKPLPDDIIQERLYCIQWMKPKEKGKGYDYEFRSVTPKDIKRERIVENYVASHIDEWQRKGFIPDMRIEVGGPPRYQGLDLVRARGWTHWQHLFNPRQLLMGGLIRGEISSYTALGFLSLFNCNSKLSRWHPAREYVAETFDNQALNTLFNYACQSFLYGSRFFSDRYSLYPVKSHHKVNSRNAAEETGINDIYLTDPPYGDAVKYEEILDFFIAWLRKNPPPEFADWIWDSRRSMAIKGEGEDFRRGMVAAYKRMTKCMPDNGIQVIMFTHQSGAIWADMANIVWASGLQVTAAWYVVTETNSALRDGSYVKGTVLLVCRKRLGKHKSTRDDLAWEIKDEVEEQVKALTGLNQEAKGLYRDENVFEDADIQMAGYAAALRALTRYAVIDGRDMTTEAIRPRIKGETTFVDGLIAFAVDTANQCLVPQGIPKTQWDKLTSAERFYLKMIELEARGVKTLDNYQNFAKAFKVKNFHALMVSRQANNARLKSAEEFGRSEMGESSEFYQSVLRAVLYAIMELNNNMDGTDVLAHLTLNIADYYTDMTRRELAVELADYLAKHLEDLRPEEAGAARILRELIKNQRLG
jgi:putative DNA methylase